MGMVCFSVIMEHEPSYARLSEFPQTRFHVTVQTQKLDHEMETIDDASPSPCARLKTVDPPQSSTESLLVEQSGYSLLGLKLRRRLDSKPSLWANEG